MCCRLTSCYLLRHLHLTSAISPSLTLCPSLTPLFVHAGWLSCQILLHHLQVLMHCRLTSCLLWHLRLTSTSLHSLHRHFHCPLSQCRGHCRHPQMYSTPSWWRHCQRPLPPLNWLLSSDKSACTAASSSLLLPTRGGYNEIKLCRENREMTEEGGDVEAFHVCVKFTLNVSPGQPC